MSPRGDANACVPASPSRTRSTPLRRRRCLLHSRGGGGARDVVGATENGYERLFMTLGGSPVSMPTQPTDLNFFCVVVCFLFFAAFGGFGRPRATALQRIPSLAKMSSFGSADVAGSCFGLSLLLRPSARPPDTPEHPFAPIHHRPPPPLPALPSSPLSLLQRWSFFYPPRRCGDTPVHIPRSLNKVWASITSILDIARERPSFLFIARFAHRPPASDL